MQRAALLDAARSLLSEGGTEALTFPALAERTGLARSSVYEYFRSRAAVVEELCEVDFPVWAADVSAAMERAGTAEAKVEAYVRRQLELVGTGGTGPWSRSPRVSSTRGRGRRSGRRTAGWSR